MPDWLGLSRQRRQRRSDGGCRRISRMTLMERVAEWHALGVADLVGRHMADATTDPVAEDAPADLVPRHVRCRLQGRRPALLCVYCVADPLSQLCARVKENHGWSHT